MQGVYQRAKSLEMRIQACCSRSPGRFSKREGWGVSQPGVRRKSLGQMPRSHMEITKSYRQISLAGVFAYEKLWRTGDFNGFFMCFLRRKKNGQEWIYHQIWTVTAYLCSLWDHRYNKKGDCSGLEQEVCGWQTTITSIHGMGISLGYSGIRKPGYHYYYGNTIVGI